MKKKKKARLKKTKTQKGNFILKKTGGKKKEKKIKKIEKLKK